MANDRRVPGTAMVVAAIAAAVAIAAPFAEPREGLATRPYLDPARILTVCYGETEGVEARIYSRDECAAKLRKRMARDYAPPVLACVPGLAEPRRRFAFAAAIDASYNAGPAAFCRSAMARQFNAGRWAQGCAAFRGWYVTARVKGRAVRLRGLVERREAEAKLCLRSA